jgi:ribonuclease HII
LETNVIDEINILNASEKAMQKCALKLEPQPIYVIINGNAPFTHKTRIKNKGGKVYTKDKFDILSPILSTNIVKGDEKFNSIAGTSFLARTYRYEYMNRIHVFIAGVQQKKNKSYPTEENRETIWKYGVTKYR